MKIPLRYQMTEYDCATVSLENAISYLFDRENIPVSVIKGIFLYTLDCYDDGKLGHGGTSVESVDLITHFIKECSLVNDLGIKCRHLLGIDITDKVLRGCINKKGCILVRSYLSGEHYVLVTDIDKRFVYLWDPYYLDNSYFGNKKGVDIIGDEPFKYNRKVDIGRFYSYLRIDYSLGPLLKRECVLFWRKGGR